MKIKVDKDSVKVLDRIVEFKLSDDNQSVVAIEQCDEWFSTDLSKVDLSILIDKLIELRDRLEVIDSEIIGVKTMNKLEELKRDTRLLSDKLKTEKDSNIKLLRILYILISFCIGMYLGIKLS